MKIRTLLLGTLLLLVAPASCSNNPLIEDCVENNTSEVTFRNTSGRSSYDVIWDGARKVSSLGPGQGSETFTENTGSHSLTFKYAGTNRIACSTSYPNLVQCGSIIYSCRY